MNTNSIISIQDLSAGYNGKPVLKDISFNLEKGEILGVIGQNGCGKSTLLKAIFGMTPYLKGKIFYAGKNIINKEAHELLELGIAYYVQGGMVFPRLTIEEHLFISMNGNYKSAKEKKNKLEETYLRFPQLSDSRNKRGGNLSGGLRQILSFAMLINGNKKNIWLLDEPTAGLSPELAEYTSELIKDITDKDNISVILVEHNYNVAFSLSDNIITIKESIVSEKYPNTQVIKEDFLQNNLYN